MVELVKNHGIFAAAQRQEGWLCTLEKSHQLQGVIQALRSAQNPGGEWYICI